MDLPKAIEFAGLDKSPEGEEEEGEEEEEELLAIRVGPVPADCRERVPTPRVSTTHMQHCRSDWRLTLVCTLCAKS